MSIDNPIFGVDLSHWNQGFSVRKAKAEGIKFVVAKATEGPYRDGSKYVDTSYKSFRRAALLNRIPVFGAYHFLTATNPQAQAIHFLKTVGRVKNKLLMVDFEAYSSYPSLTPDNWHLKAFIREVKNRTNGHKVLLYSGVGFWNSGNTSGDFDQYGADLCWDAYYPLGDTTDAYKPLYQRAHRASDGAAWGERWGNREVDIWQYTPAGHVGGMNVDCNAYRGTIDELKRLAR